MARALVARDFRIDSLGLVDIEDPVPGAGQVVVAIRAAALNPVEVRQLAGPAAGDASRLPLRFGREASGVVTEVGADAVGLEGEHLAVGDEVYGNRLDGAQATAIAVDAADLLLKPAALGFVEAAGLLTVGTTAIHALEVVSPAQGETVLIHGVAGSVGRLTAQLAMLRGARVVGTAAPRHHAELRAAGIVPVAYGEGLLERVRVAAPDGVAAAVDTAGTDEALAVSLELVADRDRVVTAANFRTSFGAGIKVIGGGAGADPGREIRSAARLELNGLAAEGRISVPIAATFPIERAADAYRLVAAGHAGGKVVLTF